MLNGVQLMGRLTRDPQLAGEDKGSHVRFNLAVGRSFKRDGEDNTDFIPCVVFGKAAENMVKYLKKGSLIVVAGELRSKSYNNAQNQKVWTLQVVVDRWYFASGRKESEAEMPTAGEFDPILALAEEDDLPFA